MRVNGSGFCLPARILLDDAQALTQLFSHTSWTQTLLEQYKSREQDGKWGRSREKPEHRVVSLSGSDGAEKQEGQSEGKGAHVVPAPVGPFQRADISPWIAINAS